MGDRTESNRKYRQAHPKTVAAIKARYEKKVMRRYELRYHKGIDSDIVAKLDSVPNKNDYVRGLIRKDISEEK